MSHLTALLLCLAGFAGLALGTDRQQRIVFERALGRSVKVGLWSAAALSLVLALAVLVGGHGWSLGLVMFNGHTSLAAALVHCALITYGRLQT